MKQGKWKSNTKVSREELAAELEALAAQIRQERFEFQEMEFSFYPGAALEKRLSMKDGRLQLDVCISIRAASTLQDSGSKASGPFRGSVPFSRKKLKKPLAAAWKALKRDLEGGGAVEPGMVHEFSSLMERYGRAADDAWLEEWKRCEDLALECVKAAEAGDRQKALELAREVDALTKQCHKKFK